MNTLFISMVCALVVGLASAIPAVELGLAGDYAILTKAGITNVPKSIIMGNIAVSPIAATAMTGFSLVKDATNAFATSSQVTGQVFAATYGTPTPALLTTAVSNMETAYTDAAGRTNTDAARINLGAGTLGGVFGGAGNELTPGVYSFTTSVTIADEIIFEGGATDVFIIQIPSDLIMNANLEVTLSGGALAKNIFWQVAGTVTVGAGVKMKGNLLVATAVTFKTGSVLDGRILAQTFAALQKAKITKPV